MRVVLKNLKKRNRCGRTILYANLYTAVDDMLLISATLEYIIGESEARGYTIINLDETIAKVANLFN